MIRIKGFARKNRRLTKGGSLPDKSVDLRAQNSVSPDVKLEMEQHGRNGNGTQPNNGNGSEHNGDSNGVTEYLHEAVADLVSEQRGERLTSKPSSNGANGANGHRDLDNEPTLRTVFARPTFDRSESQAAKSMPVWKRTLDVTCILIGLPVWMPLLAVVMIWIRAVSPGPIFYRQERIGYRRSRFMIFKFRTMHVNVETRTHEEYFAHLMRMDCPMTKLDAVDDSRLIRCGRFLRASGLDELPQIFNVLRGEMSLVGPRPCLPKEFERYEVWHQERVNAPPGLTGYWQVNGKNKTTFSEMITMDILYGKKMSLWLDLWIMLRTVPALVIQTMESRASSGSDAVNPRSLTRSSLAGSTEKI